MRRKDAKRICHPTFSDVDADLASRKWRADRYGYARMTTNSKTNGRKVATTTLAHRIVIERMLGRKPAACEITDHIDRNRLNNRRENLRVVSLSTNSSNRSPKSPSGVCGVSFHRGVQRWQAQFKHKGRGYYCGLHDTPEQAAGAIAAKRAQLEATL